jgi:hypothetical protein
VIWALQKRNREDRGWWTSIGVGFAHDDRAMFQLAEEISDIDSWIGDAVGQRNRTGAMGDRKEFHDARYFLKNATSCRVIQGVPELLQFGENSSSLESMIPATDR